MCGLKISYEGTIASIGLMLDELALTFSLAPSVQVRADESCKLERPSDTFHID